jgi:hypothetical protein
MNRISPVQMDNVIFAKNLVQDQLKSKDGKNLSNDLLGRKLYRLNFRASKKKYGRQAPKPTAFGPVDSTRLHDNYRYHVPSSEQNLACLPPHLQARKTVGFKLHDAYLCLCSLISECSVGTCVNSYAYKYLVKIRALLKERIYAEHKKRKANF